MDDIETKHLRVDWTGQVYLGDHRLGFIDNEPSWPRRFGPEPGWFEPEVADLVDQFEDAQGNDYRPEAAAAFRRALGGLK